MKKQIDPYSVLGVARNADPETIKTAYRRLAKAHHPDAGGDADRFAEATLAYDVLMDAARRKKFDETGRVDDKSVAGMQGMAEQVIFDLIALSLMGEADPLAVNLVQQFSVHLGKQIADLHARNQVLDRARRRADRMKKQFIKKRSKKDTEGNKLAPMLERHQQQIGDAIEQNECNIEVLGMALDILKNYEFSADGGNAFTIRYFGGGASGTSTAF